MVYFSQLCEKTLNFASTPFLLEKWLLRLPQGWRITMNFPIRYTVDNVGSPPSIDASKICIEYSSLESPDQIRLLRTHPGEPDDSIETSFVTASLDDTPDYEALSYTWGSLTERSLISVNGDYMPVPRSALKALHALRRSRCERLIWVDAVSINQEETHAPFRGRASEVHAGDPAHQ